MDFIDAGKKIGIGKYLLLEDTFERSLLTELRNKKIDPSIFMEGPNLFFKVYDYICLGLTDILVGFSPDLIKDEDHYIYVPTKDIIRIVKESEIKNLQSKNDHLKKSLLPYKEKLDLELRSQQ